MTSRPHADPRPATCRSCRSLLADVNGRPVCFHCTIENGAGITARERLDAVRTTSRYLDPAELEDVTAA